jgi:Na+/proline symporter
LLSVSHGPGIEFGVTLIIAILAANMFHQGFWQRVYACRDEQVLRTSFFRAGLVVIPLIILAGVLGLMALGKGVAEAHSSVALFHLVMAATPPWVGVAVLLLALALVMSSMDTLLNGMVSAITTDLAGLTPRASRTGLLRRARVLTVLLAVPAVLIAARGYSVLYLFLVADLVCAGAVFPVFYGMYARRLSGRACIASCAVGIATGVLFFPKPDFTPWLNIPFGGRFVVSFGLALGVSSLLAVVADRVAARSSLGRAFDFGRMQEQVQLIEG